MLKGKIVTFDVETTTKNKGNPFTQDNQLVMYQLKINNDVPQVFHAYEREAVVEILESADLVIGFNLKFDMHWLQRTTGHKLNCVWDVQLAEFILSRQQWKYPDLAKTCENYGVQQKLDIVKEDYWSKGIDTTEIPWEILAEYGAGDVESTYQCFLKQVARFQAAESSMYRLFRLHCNDLVVLQEMEYNGIMYDATGSLMKSEELTRQITHIEAKLYAFLDSVPVNLDSRDHISAFLYGGKITEEVRIPVGEYKTGAKIGQTRYKIHENVYELPRLVEPLKGSELKKEGYFATDEPTLLSLKPKATAKKIITWLLERSKLVKLRSTYLEGLPNLITEMDWPKDMLHSNLNQTVATTGRLSSTKPNQQNLNPVAKQFCISRF